MTLYTVYNSNNGNVILRGASVEDAAHAMLTDDGYRYEVRRMVEADETGPACWELWVSDGSENSTRSARHLHSTVLRYGVVYAKDRDRAWKEFAELVVRYERAGTQAMPDADYDEMLTEGE